MNSLAVHPGEGRTKSMDYRSTHLLDTVSRLSSFHPSSGKLICCLTSLTSFMCSMIFALFLSKYKICWSNK